MGEGTPDAAARAVPAEPGSAAGSFLLVFVGVVLFSTVEVVTKWIGPAIPPLRLALLRFLIMGLVLLVPGALDLRRRKIRPRRHEAVLALGLGFTGIVLGIGLFHLALIFLQANSGAIIFSANPVFTAFLAPLLLKETLSVRHQAAMGLGLLGVLVFLWERGGFSFHATTGVLLMGGSMAAFALYSIMAKRCMPTYGLWAVTAFSALAGSLMLLPITWALEGRPWGGDGMVWPWARLAYLSLGATTLGYAAYLGGLQRVAVSRGSMLFFLKPVIASLLAYLLLGEASTWTTWTGTALILLALAVGGAPAPRREKTE